ncbi:hypothetical protein PR001_g33549 [Phytophthora rubi]|uniref:Uncharacterized protein n=1 Tax=Phytophthora rubi TaxID=129364 RepID=A0A6A3G089_9STRA|nr:hypothetical protein PR002_g32853 [Phytophthora rubi]KAE8951857.1 hypothetical protein PR001_g33549 [Phytophthora rubi]
MHVPILKLPPYLGLLAAVVVCGFPFVVRAHVISTAASPHFSSRRSRRTDGQTGSPGRRWSGRTSSSSRSGSASRSGNRRSTGI